MAFVDVEESLEGKENVSPKQDQCMQVLLLRTAAYSAKSSSHSKSYENNPQRPVKSLLTGVLSRFLRG
ncbi:hypothetical protein EYF80_039415 [Liparis tanakae]|uniref:Uncharacterized protein n=1 Tax=Liparis tanakae TaxID=230148 RepID=A0A4Z2GB05_9TELE|nr:hypothetical protein EYF80_039415 [Liparis tanakae]